MSDNQSERKHSSKTETITKFKVELPKKFGVFVLNNPVSHPEAVMDVLTTVFNQTKEDSFKTMLFAHTTGKSVVLAAVSNEIANTKQKEAMDYCMKRHEEEISFNGYLGRYDMLKFTVEEME